MPVPMGNHTNSASLRSGTALKREKKFQYFVEKTQFIIFSKPLVLGVDMFLQKVKDSSAFSAARK